MPCTKLSSFLNYVRSLFNDFIFGYRLTGKSEGGEGGGKSGNTSQRSSMKVVISESHQRASSGGANASFSDSIKKGLLKSMSTAGSQEKGGLDAKASANRAPSPIPEDPREDETNKSSKGPPRSPASKTMMDSDAVKNTGSKEGEKDLKDKNVAKDQIEKSTDNEEKLDNGEEPEQKAAEDEEEKKEKKSEEEIKKKDNRAPKPDPGPAKQEEAITTTKLRGKSKATGQMMGGWI